MYQLSQDCDLSSLPVYLVKWIIRQHPQGNSPVFTLQLLLGNYQGITLCKQVWPKNNYRVTDD